jgi:phage terminase large subunit-like protein
MYPDWYPKSLRYNRAVKGRIFCEDFQKAGSQVIVPAIEEWLNLDLVAKKTRNPMGFPIHWRLRNGSTFEVLTYEQKTAHYEGWKGDLAWFDEPPSRDKYIATLRGLVDTNGRTWLTLTPLSQPWLYDELVTNPSGNDIKCITMDIRDNVIREVDGIKYGHLTEDAIQRFEDSLNPEEKEARLHGKFLHLTGLVYKNFDAMKYVVPVEIKPHWSRYMAIDPHPRTPTACLWLAVDELDNYWIYDEMFIDGLDIKEIAHAIKAQEGKYPADVRYIDPAMDKENPIFGTHFNIRKELMRHGIYTIRANNEWEYGKDCVDRAIQPKWVPMLGEDSPRLHVGSNCTRLIHEFTHYVWEFKKRTEEQASRQKPIKRDDHMMDCLRYILAANPTYMTREEDDSLEDGPTFKGEYTKYPVKNSEGKTAYHELVDHAS